VFFILGWCYQPGRVQAGIYLLFYTLFASLPLLVGILFVYNSLGFLCLFLFCGDSFLVGGLFYVCMVLAFLVKIPIFMVHLVKAPIFMVHLVKTPIFMDQLVKIPIFMVHL